MTTKPQRLSYYIDPDPGSWGDDCPDSTAQRANEILADMIENEFPGVHAIIGHGRNIHPDCGEIDDWITENYGLALDRAST